MPYRLLLPGPALIIALAALGWFLHGGALEGVLSASWIDREIRDREFAGALLFVVVCGLAVSVSIPRHLVSFLGGYAFGASMGALLALAATMVGCILIFILARGYVRPYVAARIGPRIRRIEDFLAANPFSMTLLVRMLPGTNNLAVCLAAGASKVPARPFLLGSAVGYAPLTLVMALAGSGVESGGMAQVVAAGLGFVACGAAGLWLYRRFRGARRFEGGG